MRYAGGLLSALWVVSIAAPNAAGADAEGSLIARALSAAERCDDVIHSICYEAECEGRTALTPRSLTRRWHVIMAVSGDKRFAEIGHYLAGLSWRDDPDRCQSFVSGPSMDELWLCRRFYLKFRSIPGPRVESYERLKTDFFFECSGCWPRACRMDGERNEVSTRALLSGGGSWEVSRRADPIAGTEVAVLSSADHELWLAPEMNFAVVRRASRLLSTDRFKVVYANSDFVEVAPGVWLPKLIERTMLRDPTAPIDSSQARDAEADHPAVPDSDDVWAWTRLRVTSLDINNVEDRVFQPILPPGTLCVDVDAKSRTVLPGGREMLEEIVSLSRSIISHNAPVGWTNGERMRLASFGLMGIAVAAAAVGYVKRRRA